MASSKLTETVERLSERIRNQAGHENNEQWTRDFLIFKMLTDGLGWGESDDMYPKTRDLTTMSGWTGFSRGRLESGSKPRPSTCPRPVMLITRRS